MDMEALTIASALFAVGPKAEIRAEIRDWMTDWEATPRPMHGAWLKIEDLTFSLPLDAADRLVVLDRLALAVEALTADCHRAQKAPEIVTA
jgi:hypothetical protein